MHLYLKSEEQDWVVSDKTFGYFILKIETRILYPFVMHLLWGRGEARCFTVLCLGVRISHRGFSNPL